MNVRREGAEEECDGTGVEGIGEWGFGGGGTYKRKILQASGMRRGKSPGNKGRGSREAKV